MKKILLIFVVMLISINTVFASNMIIESNSQEVDMFQNKVNLSGNVKVKIDDVMILSTKATGNIDPKTNKIIDATFHNNPYAYQVQGDRKNEIKAQIIKASLLNKVIMAEGNTQSIMSSKNQPVLTVNSDMQEYDTKIDQMRANENVIIHYQDVETYSNKAIVDVTRKGQVKKMQLIGNVKITQKDNLTVGNKITYTASSDEVVSVGDTYSDMKMDDGQRIQVWAEFQQYNRRSNTIIASNNVKVIFGEYTAFGPKVSVYPDQNNKFNKVIFTGRSKILEKGRSVEADRIILTLNPKNFFAQGNVRTTIPNVNLNNE